MTTSSRDGHTLEQHAKDWRYHMRKLMIATAALLATSGVALAQQGPAAAPTTPAARPAPQAPTAAPTTPAARPAPQAPTAAPTTLPTGAAASVVQAKQAADARIAARRTACEAKGAAYKWKAPHIIGDVNPKGGFYTTNYNGGCSLMSMREAIASGVVTMNPNAKRN